MTSSSVPAPAEDAASVRIRPHPERRGAYELLAEMHLPVELDRLFAFFADAANLETLTPAWLRFSIRSPQPITMEVGSRIVYRLRLRGIPLAWQSEITVWEPPYRFVDEQVRGPYRFWRHEHTFLADGEGTHVRDRVEYRAPGGRLAHGLLVKPDLLRIFRYRHQRLNMLFAARQ